MITLPLSYLLQRYGRYAFAILPPGGVARAVVADVSLPPLLSEGVAVIFITFFASHIFLLPREFDSAYATLH